MDKILIIEDDADINSMLNTALTQSGYDCTCAYSGTEGLLRLEREAFDLVLLDLMLPGMRGEEVLAKGKQFSTAPFIILSAIDELDSKVKLLTAGADDYVTKPFELDELRARILVQLRKNTKDEETDFLSHKDMVMDINSHVVTVNGEKMQLTVQEYKILELFLKNRNRVFSKQEIYQYAWDDYYMGEDKTINVHVSNIRQKIKKITDVEYIDTIWGIGFRLSK